MSDGGRFPRVVVVMGVCGSGKTTFGKRLAERIGGEFFDGDDFHPLSNIAKMAAGHPLDDFDRAPWLARMYAEVVCEPHEGKAAVLACSALKEIYRTALGVAEDGVVLVYLQGDRMILEERMRARERHFMKPEMLASQLEQLEEPTGQQVLVLNVADSLEEQVGHAVRFLEGAV